MICDHKKRISFVRRYAIVEFGAHKCPSCDAYVRFRKLDVNLANMLLVMAFGVVVVLSIKYRSYFPYLLLLGVYTASRLWLIVKAPLVETEKSRGLSFVWFALFTLFLCAFNGLLAINATGGYSGNGVGYNNPSMQNVPNVGPILQGSWTIGTPYNSPNVGPFAIPITPNPGTNDYGRTDFRIHGDNSCMCGSASEGCVIYNRNIRNEIDNSGDTTFIVVP